MSHHATGRRVLSWGRRRWVCLAVDVVLAVVVVAGALVIGWSFPA